MPCGPAPARPRARDRELGYANAEGRANGGFRSVYEAAPEHYRALFERGILRRAELRAATG
jgi:hypothetical protein